MRGKERGRGVHVCPKKKDSGAKKDNTLDSSMAQLSVHTTASLVYFVF